MHLLYKTTTRLCPCQQPLPLQPRLVCVFFFLERWHTAWSLKMFWFHLMFILFLFLLFGLLGLSISNQHHLYTVLPWGGREFPIVVEWKWENDDNRKQSIPKWLYWWCVPQQAVTLPCYHSKVEVELLDRVGSFPSDGEIRGCRGPTGARRQIKQGGYPWSDTWSHFKGWERHWSPVISSERQSVRVKGGKKGSSTSEDGMSEVESSVTSKSGQTDPWAFGEVMVRSLFVGKICPGEKFLDEERQNLLSFRLILYLFIYSC